MQQRQAKRQGLAAAGLGQRQQILPRQRRRNDQLLDAGRRLQGGGQRGKQSGMEGKFAKGHGATSTKKWEAKSSERGPRSKTLSMMA